MLSGPPGNALVCDWLIGDRGVICGLPTLILWYALTKLTKFIKYKLTSIC